MQWFRVYNDILTDWKLETLAFEDQRHFVFVLACKSSGHLDEPYPNKEALDRAMGRRLGILGDALEQAKRRLVDAGLIDDTWQPLAWNKRQFKSDQDSTAAERQRRYRASQASRVTSRVTSRTSNGTVTRLDTDTDTEQIQNRSKTLAPTRAEKPARSVPKVEHVRFVNGQEDPVGHFEVAKEIRMQWLAAYPAVQIGTELEKAAAWAAANPTKRKKDWRRFLNNWMSRCQERTR